MELIRIDTHCQNQVPYSSMQIAIWSQIISAKLFCSFSVHLIFYYYIADCENAILVVAATVDDYPITMVAAFIFSDYYSFWLIIFLQSYLFKFKLLYYEYRW